MKFLKLTLVCAVCNIGHSPWVMAQRAPDQIFVNGKIVTVDDSFSVQQAVAVADEQILAVGTNEAIGTLAGPRDPNHGSGRTNRDSRIDRQP